MNLSALHFFVAVSTMTTLAFAEMRFKIESIKGCSNNVEIFVAQNKKLVFQIPGVQGIESSVFLNKGAYAVTVLGTDCHFEKMVELTDDTKVTEVVVRLQRSEKSRTPSSTGFMSPERSYTYGMEGRYNLPPGALNVNLNYSIPYWYPYVQQNYSNYQWPCMWNMFGCNSYNYPVRRHQNYPNGPIVMGKPNIYVQGPDSQNLKLTFLENSEGRFMASTPAMVDNFWEFDLKGNAIVKNSVLFSYFFFDARTPTKADYNLDKAYCGLKEELLKFMIEHLEQRQFPKAAVTDFKQYWIFKLPDVESCVFPQTEKNIQSFFPLELSRKNEKVSAAYNRIYFVVVPKSAPVSQLPLKFKSNPKKWIDRQPSASGTYQIYEWGVGFLAH